MIHLEITTPEKGIFSGEVMKVTLPGSMGPFQVLQNHAPLISTLQQGAIVYSDGSKEEQTFAVETGGVVEVRNNRVDVMLV